LYLPSKTKLKFLIIYLLVVFLLFLPFKGAIRNLFSFFSHQLKATTQRSVQENEKLKKENISLQIKLRGSQHLKKENQDLRKALDFKADKEFDLIGVGVLSFSPSSWRRYLLLNGGEDIGLKEGLLAVNEKGELLGKITDVKSTCSHLLLINDPNFNLSVFVGELGSGLLKGNLTGAKILYIEDNEAVKKGDRIWVEAYSSASVIEVGTIKSVKKGTNQLFCEITVSLAFQGAFFDKVFILR